MEIVTIRVLRAGDAESVARLSASLGYPTSAAEVQLRIELLADSNDRIAFAAILQDAVIGWIDAAVERRGDGSPRRGDQTNMHATIQALSSTAVLPAVCGLSRSGPAHRSGAEGPAGDQVGSLVLAAWPSGLGRGLQSPVPRFESGRRLRTCWTFGTSGPTFDPVAPLKCRETERRALCESSGLCRSRAQLGGT